MQRGPYKKYLRDENLPIPESTIRSRQGEAQGRNEQSIEDQNVHDDVDDLQNIDEVNTNDGIYSIVKCLLKI